MVAAYLSDGDYDSQLSRPDQRHLSKLDLLLRVHLNPINPSAGKDEGHFVHAGMGMNIWFLRWKPEEWRTFKDEFKKDAESQFNFPTMGLWLRPVPRFGQAHAAVEMDELRNPRPMSKRFAPVVQCGLSVTLVDSAAKSHVSFDVIRLKDDIGFRSNVHPVAGKQDTGTLTHLDIRLWSNGGPNGQNVIAHEVGHALGMKHSNDGDPACQADPNTYICYGRPGTPEYRNLMGRGNELTEANAGPWAKALSQRTPSLDWKATTMLPNETHMLWVD